MFFHILIQWSLSILTDVSSQAVSVLSLYARSSRMKKCAHNSIVSLIKSVSVGSQSMYSWALSSGRLNGSLSIIEDWIYAIRQWIINLLYLSSFYLRESHTLRWINQNATIKTFTHIIILKRRHVRISNCIQSSDQMEWDICPNRFVGHRTTSDVWNLAALSADVLRKDLRTRLQRASFVHIHQAVSFICADRVPEEKGE